MNGKRKNNFSEWYNEILDKAKILDIRYPVKGLYVWFQYGFKIRRLVLENIRKILENSGHDEVLFPLLIPDQEFAKEAKHIRGFENEVYWVTHGGREPLNVKLALRPTSETAIYPMFSLWIRSHGNMPFRIYQVVNTFRYETKHTRPMLRLREITTFVEAHTVHSTLDDAKIQVKEAISGYREFFELLGVPYAISQRLDWDKFPGAEYTIAFDTIFPDGRTLQIATVHNLGQNFAKTFEIKFENKNGEQSYAYQTCYGISDRVIASTLVHHGDDSGLCLIPNIAPVQIVIVPIWFKDSKKDVDKVIKKLKEDLNEFRINIDDRELRPGNKFYDWEVKGVPLRLEVGPAEIKKSEVIAVRRDTGTKIKISMKNIAMDVKKQLDDITINLKSRAWSEFNDQIHDVTSIEELKSILSGKGGIIRFEWCGDRGCAKTLEVETGSNLLGTLNADGQGKCLRCNKESKGILQVGRTY